MVEPQKRDNRGELKENVRKWLTASDVKEAIQDLLAEVYELRQAITELQATLNPDMGKMTAYTLEGVADDLEKQYGKGTIFLKSGRESSWEALREHAQRVGKAAEDGRRRWESMPCPQCRYGRITWKQGDAPNLGLMAECDVCGVSVNWSDVTFNLDGMDDTR